MLLPKCPTTHPMKATDARKSNIQLHFINGRNKSKHAMLFFKQVTVFFAETAQ